jgi:hypothetical protein
MDPKNELSDREKQLMALAWLCFSEKPKVRKSHSPEHLPRRKNLLTRNPHRSTTRNSPASRA